MIKGKLKVKVACFKNKFTKEKAIKKAKAAKRKI